MEGQRQMKLSAEEIDAAKTTNGGWTKKQLAQWGVPWPPPKGWRKALIRGTELPSPRRARKTRFYKRPPWFSDVALDVLDGK